MIKLGLIGMLTFYYFSHASKYRRRHIIYLLLFAVLLFIPCVCVEALSANIIVSYFFPLLFVFLTFVLGNTYEMNQKQLITFFNVVICAVGYMAVYAVVFRKELFLSAFSLSNAYNHELSSFLVSNHEYGLYLVGGITGCLICLHLKRSLPFRKNLPYYAALILFIPNLILTYSRTSILGITCILASFVFLSKRNKLKKAIIIILVVATGIIYNVSKLRSFFTVIVFKGNTSAGRDTLYNLAIDYFKKGSITQKLFGYGITESRHFFENTTSHGSIHNAYLQILIYFGVVMLFVMIVFLISQLYANMKLYRKDKFSGAICTALLIMCMCVMFFNTASIFNSGIDSYFLTVFSIVIPKYVRNSINSGTFDLEDIQ